MSADRQRAWAVGLGGTILRTEDAGANWQTMTSETIRNLFSIQMSGDGQRGWAVGQGGTILLLSNPDLSKLRAANSAAAIDDAVAALAPPQGVAKQELENFKKLEADAQNAEQQLVSLRHTVEFMARQVREPPPQPVNGNGSSDLLNPIYVRAYLNRAIVMLIVFFSVSVLLSVFRYSLRLASQYDGRADALRLSGGEIDKRFHRMVHTMVPTGVDFGKMPRSPGEMAFDMARDMARTAKNRPPTG